FDEALNFAPDLFAYMPARSLAYSAVNGVQFEVTAEANRLLVRPRRLDDDTVIPELRDASGGTMPVIDGPGNRLVDMPTADGGTTLSELYAVTALRPDGGLRVMFYGTT